MPESEKRQEDVTRMMLGNWGVASSLGAAISIAQCWSEQFQTALEKGEGKAKALMFNYWALNVNPQVCLKP